MNTDLKKDVCSRESYHEVTVVYFMLGVFLITEDLKRRKEFLFDCNKERKKGR